MTVPWSRIFFYPFNTTKYIWEQRYTKSLISLSQSETNSLFYLLQRWYEVSAFFIIKVYQRCFKFSSLWFSLSQKTLSQKSLPESRQVFIIIRLNQSFVKSLISLSQKTLSQKSLPESRQVFTIIRLDQRCFNPLISLSQKSLSSSDLIRVSSSLWSLYHKRLYHKSLYQNHAKSLPSSDLIRGVSTPLISLSQKSLSQ